jgi:hypothetical protein
MQKLAACGWVLNLPGFLLLLLLFFAVLGI